MISLLFVLTPGGTQQTSSPGHLKSEDGQKGKVHQISFFMGGGEGEIQGVNGRHLPLHPYQCLDLQKLSRRRKTWNATDSAAARIAVALPSPPCVHPKTDQDNEDQLGVTWVGGSPMHAVAASPMQLFLAGFSLVARVGSCRSVICMNWLLHVGALHNLCSPYWCLLDVLVYDSHCSQPARPY